MKILHITSIANPDGNGVAVAVNNYIKYESKHTDIALYNLEGNLHNDFCNYYNYENYKKIEELPEPFCKPDLVIFNEVYKPHYINLYKECIKRKIKYIIIPHGCLVKESQKKNKTKKIIGNILLFNKFINNASAIQFLNEREMNNTSFKYKKAIIAGNGVSKPLYKNELKTKNKDLVFIGRYEIKHKGLDLLIKICDENHKWFVDNNIRIQLYGRDSGNELKALIKLINEKKVEDIIIINGPVYNEEKANILKNSYAFIQCSRFEGQPMGIIEALSVGIPCIVTYGTYLGEYIYEKKCGLACTFDSAEVFEAIKKIVNNQDIRNELAKNAFKHSNIDFAWDNVIKKTIEKYKTIK